MASTPTYFKHIRNVALGLIALVAALQAAASQFEGSKLYDFIQPYFVEIGLIAFVAAFMAQQVTKEPPETL